MVHRLPAGSASLLSAHADQRQLWCQRPQFAAATLHTIGRRPFTGSGKGEQRRGLAPSLFFVLLYPVRQDHSGAIDTEIARCRIAEGTDQHRPSPLQSAGVAVAQSPKGSTLETWQVSTDRSRSVIEASTGCPWPCMGKARYRNQGQRRSERSSGLVHGSGSASQSLGDTAATVAQNERNLGLIRCRPLAKFPNHQGDRGRFVGLCGKPG